MNVPFQLLRRHNGMLTSAERPSQSTNTVAQTRQPRAFFNHLHVNNKSRKCQNRAPLSKRKRTKTSIDDACSDKIINLFDDDSSVELMEPPRKRPVQKKKKKTKTFATVFVQAPKRSAVETRVVSAETKVIDLFSDDGDDNSLSSLDDISELSGQSEMEEEVWERLRDSLQTRYASMVDSSAFPVSEEIQFDLDAMPLLEFDVNLVVPWHADNTFGMNTNEENAATTTNVHPSTEEDEEVVCIPRCDDTRLDFLDEIDLDNSFSSDSASLVDETDLLHEFDLHSTTADPQDASEIVPPAPDMKLDLEEMSFLDGLDDGSIASFAVE